MKLPFDTLNVTFSHTVLFGHSRRPTAGIREVFSSVGAATAHAPGTDIHVLRLGSGQRTSHDLREDSWEQFLNRGNSSVLSCETRCTSLMSP